MPVSGKEMLKLLAREGWYLVRVKGSHHILAKDGNPQVIIVPVHGNRTLAPGTESFIRKQAGLK
jgi:predicted RNA binding protein YcfA (HicA-like mRNA interferase family)